MPVSNLNPVTGNAQGVDDTLRGTHGDDLVQGLSGDDVLKGARGDDRMIGGKGNDVIAGGIGADTFVWSAGHIGEGEVDYVTDFSFRQEDAIQFLDSASSNFEVLSVEIENHEETEANGVDLRNRQVSANDVVFTVRNSATGATQEIVILDSWSRGLNSQWEATLAEMGLVFGDNTDPEEDVEIIVPIEDGTEVQDVTIVPPTDEYTVT